MRTLRSTTARPSLLVRWVLHWYPAAWRDRYEVEVASLLAGSPPSAGQVWDLARGALDARRHPDLVAVPAGLRLAMAGPSPASRPGVPRYGAVASTPIGELSRRTFMRRMVGAGAALLSLEFLAGTLAFLWPQIREGVGATLRLGTLADIRAAEPGFATGTPYSYTPARIFLVNVPAAEAMARGETRSVPEPAGAELLALWRKCPHLGCQVPEPCDDVRRFQCRCHGSTFNIVGEKMKAGPASRGMDRFGVHIDRDGVVIVDTSQRIAGPPAGTAASITFDDGRPFEATCFPV